MLRTVAALLAAVNLACAAENLSLEALNQKSLDHAIKQMPLLNRLPQPSPRTVQCAIPLKEVRAGIGKRIDPIARSAGPINFDKIARPAPIQACPSR
jgi:hypothetical protein